MLEPTVPFGRAMQESHFNFDKKYTPLNHGSFGAFPTAVRDRQRELQTLSEAKPDTFIRYILPELLDVSRAAVAPLLGVHTDEVVFVPNATTAINTVLRNLAFQQGDVILYFSTVYPAEKNTIDYVCETTPLESVCIKLEYPIEDAEVFRRFFKTVDDVKRGGRQVKIAMFDIVSTFPGVKMPWEGLVVHCKNMGILSLIDGAHGIGHVDLTRLGEHGPDFFTSNCYKWLYVPRGCAVFHVPARNQNLIRSSVPTSHVLGPVAHKETEDAICLTLETNNRFVEMFASVATIDTTPYICVSEALRFRQMICGGEESIRQYCRRVVLLGANHIAEMLGTEVMDNETHTLTSCCFANVRLPLNFVPWDCSHHGKTPDRNIYVDEVHKIGKWITERTVFDFDTMVPAKFHAGAIWVRFSGQIYLEMKDFDWAGFMLKELCTRVMNGEGRA